MQSEKPKRSDPHYQIWWRKQNAESNRASQRKYYLANKVKHIALTTANKRKNRDRTNELNRAWLEKNRAKLNAKKKDAWKKMTPEKRENVRAYVRNKRATDASFAIANRVRSRLGSAIRAVKSRKFNKTSEYLGISIQDFKAYLQSKFKPGMAWNNRRLWHIDHIIPCAAFDLTDPEQQRKCFHYSNLQPLWAHENQSKSSKIIAAKA